MRRIPLFAAALASLFSLLPGCGGEGSGTAGDPSKMGCDACKTTEVCVTNLDKGSATERCVAIPASCGKTASCAEQACVSDLYGLCEMGWLGVACSDTVAPTIVSCNPG